MQSRNEFETKMDRIFEATGAKNDTALARVLGIRPASVAGARKRQLVPGVWIEKIARDYNINANWLFFGSGFMQQEIAAAQYTAEGAQPDDSAQIVARAYERLFQALEEKSEVQKENGALREKVARLEAELKAQGQRLQDLRDWHDPQEVDVGTNKSPAASAPAPDATSACPIRERLLSPAGEK